MGYRPPSWRTPFRVRRREPRSTDAVLTRAAGRASRHTPWCAAPTEERSPFCSCESESTSMSRPACLVPCCYSRTRTLHRALTVDRGHPIGQHCRVTQPLPTGKRPSHRHARRPFRIFAAVPHHRLWAAPTNHRCWVSITHMLRLEVFWSVQVLGALCAHRCAPTPWLLRRHM